MADNKSREVYVEQKAADIDVGTELTVRLDVDVSDALTGLKAIQREAREAVKALKELEASTKTLHEALVKREGVDEYTVDAHGGYAKISIDNGESGENIIVEGPAKIVVNRD
jgi:hypothetical protein